MNYLLFEKRGCNFFSGDPDALESNIGNYRIVTPGFTAPMKDGRRFLFEFSCYDKYSYRTINKRTGAQLKKPVKDLVMTCAAAMNTEFKNENGCWRDSQIEKAFYETPRKYTEENILAYINSVSSVHYDKIKYI